jgi:hypothetical protein
VELGGVVAKLDRALQELERRWRMLEGKIPDGHWHRCPHCGAYAVAPKPTGKIVRLRLRHRPTAWMPLHHSWRP